MVVSSQAKISTLFWKHLAERFPHWYSLPKTTSISVIGAVGCLLFVALLSDDFLKVTEPTFTYEQNFFERNDDILDQRPYWNFVKITGMTDKENCGTAPAFAQGYCQTLKNVGMKFLNEEDVDLEGRSRDNPMPRYFQIDEGNRVRWSTIILRQRPGYYVFLEGFAENEGIMRVNQEFAFILDIIDRPNEFASYDDLISKSRVTVGTAPYVAKAYDRIIMSWWFAYVLGFLIGFFLTWDTISVVWYIRKERQEGTKDLMTFLGLNQTQYWISHFLAYLAQEAITFIIVFAIVVHCYSELDAAFDFGFTGGTYVYLFWVVFTAFINIGLFGFACSSLLTTENLHDAWGWTTSLVFQFITPLVMLFAFNRESAGVRFIFQFIPLLNFYFGLRDCILEIQADTVFFSVFNIFLWTGLTFYLDLVIPTYKGSQMRPYCFCCQSQSAQVSADNTSEELETGVDSEVVLHIQDLVKTFGMVTAVDGVNLSLKGDQIFGLLGFNGAGKTTTISMITGLLPPTSGQILVHGKDITKNLELLRRRMSVCPQVNILWDDLTVADHLKLFGRLRGIPDDVIKEQMDKFLDELEMTDVVNNRAKNLSGGEKRKLMIIQAFIGDPGFILLDEPTAGVDPDSGQQILDMIVRHKKDKLIILTTHHMEEADALSDEIAIMAEGKIVVRGSPTELKVKYGEGTTLEVPLDSVDTDTLEQSFDVAIRNVDGMSKIVIHNENEIMGVLKNIKGEKIQIKNNSLESVFLYLAKERAQSTQNYQGLQIETFDINAIRYERPSTCRQLQLLLKNRLCLQRKNKGPFFLATSLLLIVAMVSFITQVSFGFKNTPLNWASVGDVGKLDVYGTGPLFATNLAEFGIQRSGSVPLKSWVQDTPTNVAIEHVDSSKVNVKVDPFYVGDASVAISLLFKGEGADVIMNNEIVLGSLIASYINTYFFIIGSGCVVASIYKYTRLEIDSRRFEMQMLMGLPWASFWLINFLCDYFLVIISAIIYMTVVSYDEGENIRDGFISMLVAGTSYLFFTYTIGKMFTLNRLIVAFFGINFAVAIAISIINFTDMNWIQKVFNMGNVDWNEGLSKGTFGILVGILYLIPAGQFFLSQMLFLYLTWIPGAEISSKSQALHWLYCWLANFFWIGLFLLTEITWFSDPSPPQIEVQNPEDPIQDDKGIVVHNLSKVYQDTTGFPLIACNKVSFHVEEGRCFGLLGKNGAGKSTMINMLTTLTKPTRGKGYVKGYDIDTDQVAIRSMVGKCDQESIYWDYYTAREHLRYFGLMKGVSEEDIDDLVVHLAIKLKFAEYLDTLCAQLSGGNKRKVSLCTAVIGYIDVLFLDEPSAGVDPFARDEMRKVIVEMKKNRVCIFTSHVMEEAEIMCDDVLIMVKGEVKVTGTLHDLIEKISEGYYLRVETADLEPEKLQAVNDSLRSKLEITRTRESAKRELIFLIPFFVPLHQIFEVAIETKEEFGCNFLVESASLSQLFMRIVESDEAEISQGNANAEPNQQAIEME